jgi:branched-subunit amino acid transport protein
LYVEGKLAETYPRVVLRPGNLQGELIIGNSPSGGEAFTGALFGLALFNRMLGPSEISHHALLWKAGRAGEISAEPELAGLYLFNHTQGNTVMDRSRFGRTLTIPEYYSTLHKRRLFLLWENWSNIQDIVVNILGFVPLGFFCFIWLGGTGRGSVSIITASIFASVIVSAAIELTQAFLPTRSSSLRDLICNVVGGAVGVVLALKTKTAME